MTTYIITGQTYPASSILRDAGCTWDASRKAWITTDTGFVDRIQNNPMYYGRAKARLLSGLEITEEIDTAAAPAEVTTETTESAEVTLTGSPKQVAWATEIRAKFFAELYHSATATTKTIVIARICRDVRDGKTETANPNGKVEPVTDKVRAACEAMQGNEDVQRIVAKLDAIAAETSASWWIDRKDAGIYSIIMAD